MELLRTFTKSKLFPMDKNKEQFRDNEPHFVRPAFLDENQVSDYEQEARILLLNIMPKLKVNYCKHSLVMKRGNFYHRGTLTYFHQVETVPHGLKTRSNLEKMNPISSAPLFLMKMKFQTMSE